MKKVNNKWLNYKPINDGMHLQWFGDEPDPKPVDPEPDPKPEPGKDKNVDLDALYKEHAQDIEKWINESGVGKKVMAPWKDSMVTQGINTYKEKTEPVKIQEAVDKFRAEFTKSKDPVEAVRAEFNVKLAEESKARKRAEIKALASEVVSKLNLKLGKMKIDRFVLGSEEETNEMINEYYETIKEIEKEIRDDERRKFVKDNTYIPPAGTNEAVPFGGDEKAWAKAIKEGRSPAYGPEFEKIQKAIAAYKYGKK